MELDKCDWDVLEAAFIEECGPLEDMVDYSLHTTIVENIKQDKVGGDITDYVRSAIEEARKE